MTSRVSLAGIVLIITVMILTMIVMILEMESLTFFSPNARGFVRTRHLHAQQIRTTSMGVHGFKRTNSHA